MKHPTESKSSTDELPLFLDATTNDDAPAAVGSDENGADATPDADAASDAASAADAATDGPTAETGEACEDAPARMDHQRAAEVQATRGGTLSIGLGAAALGATIALAAAPLSPTTLEVLARYGLTPASLLIAGTVLVTTGANRSRLAALLQRIESVGKRTTDVTTGLEQGMQFLVDAQHANNERPPAAGEELQHVLVALQRQDEKVNNLTKAIKMYGKPLMEISGQSAELAGAMAQARASIEAGNETVRQSFARVESQLRTNGSQKEIADLSDIVLKVATTLDSMQKKASGTISLEPLQQQIGRVEVNLAAIAQRVEDNELRKSLLRLEDVTLKAREDVQQLLRGENLQKATHHLAETVDKATGKLARGLDQMRDGQLGALEASLRETQREITGVATVVAQIQAALKTGGRAAIAPAGPASPAAAAPAPVAPTPGAAAPERPAEAKPAAAAGDNTAYQTGTRSSNGKNVLGAIAKLKQMKN